MAKSQEQIIREVKHGTYRIYLAAKMVGKRIVHFILYVYKGGKLVLKKTYPTVHKGLVALDNAIEHFLKQTLDIKVDVPIVKG